MLGEGAEILERFAGTELVERYGATRARSSHTDREPGRLPILAGDFVTTEDGTGIVHLAPAFGEDDYRVAARRRRSVRPDQPGTLYNPVRPDGTYDERVRDRDGASYEGRFVKDPALTAELIEDLRERGLLLRSQELRALLPALLALRHAAALLRQTVLVHRHLAAARRAARGERDRQLAPAARQARALRRLAAEQRRLGALARALLGHAAAGVALRRRATST